MKQENEIGQTAENLKTASADIAEEYGKQAQQVWDDARERVRTVKQDAEEYVRENPTKAIISALGVGFILGLIIFRR